MNEELPVHDRARALDIIGAYTRDLYGARRDAALSFIADRMWQYSQTRSTGANWQLLRHLCGAARKTALNMPQPVPAGTSDPRNWFADRRERPATLEQAILLAKRSAIQW